MPDLARELRAALADPARVTDNDAVRRQHAEDMGYLSTAAPDLVVFARSRNEVADVLRVCDAARVPVIPFGAGTSLEGHVLPAAGGVSLDLSQMTGVEIAPEDLTATVQPGVLRTQLNARAGEHGLFFPVDPGADATIGGMIATNASGTTTVRYGSMRQQVLELEVVLAGGRVIRTGSRARKTSAGYDLRALFVGSEGTLGVVTEATLRLQGIPEHTVAARAVFEDVAAACRCTARAMAAGLGVSRLELMDAATVRAVNAYSGRDDPEAPCLLVEIEGQRAAAEEEMEALRELAEEEGCTAFVAERDPTARAQLWRARHNAAYAVIATAPGKRHRSTDVCVPMSALPEAVEFARATTARHGLEAAITGHVGDGNYHAVFMFDPDEPAEVERAEQVGAELVEHALSVGGTCTGEHGIGLGKKRYLEAEHGDLLPYMRAIKRTFDPHGILNPGKVFDEA